MKGAGSTVRRAAALLCAASFLAGCAARASVPVKHPVKITALRAVPHIDPGPPWTTAERASLRTTLDGIFTGTILHDETGVAVVGEDGTVLYDRHAHTPRTPASTFKLVVAYSSLETLGPDFRFTTTFNTLDPPDAGGVVHGDVWLVGGGDPTLTSNDLRAGVGTLYAAGVRKIEGNVIVDASAFHGPEQNPAWESDDLQYDYGAGTSAISLDEDVVDLRINPTTIGAPASVHVVPRNPTVTLAGAITTAYSSDLSIDRAPSVNHFTLSGQIASGIEQSYFRPAVDIPRYVGGAALEMMHDRGITVTGGVKTGVVPFATSVLWDHRSQQLSAILHTMLVNSDNHYAEQLLRTLGATRGAGTEAGGAGIERAVLNRDAISPLGLRIVDGSGLAASDRVTPIILASILERAEHEPVGSVLYRDLPRVGMEGTVRYYYLNAAAGRVRAKSGHISGVSALAGYVTTQHHARVAFAMIINDPSADSGDNGIIATLDTLATQ